MGSIGDCYGNPIMLNTPFDFRQEELFPDIPLNPHHAMAQPG